MSNRTTNPINNTLKQELNFFNKHKAEYLNMYKNQFVLIEGQELVGSFTTEAEAYKAGIERFGNEPFLIKQVVEQEASISFPALTVGVININANI